MAQSFASPCSLASQPYFSLFPVGGARIASPRWCYRMPTRSGTPGGWRRVSIGRRGTGFAQEGDFPLAVHWYNKAADTGMLLAKMSGSF